MEKKPVHNFEISGKSGGIKGLFGAKPQLSLYDDGFSWQEGQATNYVEFSKVTKLKFSKYYSTLTITYGTETKKLNLLNIGMFETIWSDFARRHNMQLKLLPE